MNNLKLGILGTMTIAVVGFFMPTTASAQLLYRDGRYCAPRYYSAPPVIYRDRFWREHEWRIAREREIIREREWRKGHWRRPFDYR